MVRLLCIAAAAAGATALLAADYEDISVGEVRWLQQIGADITLVDVREPAEYDAGHIEGAINMPWLSGYLQEHHNELPDNMLIVYCHSGGRSAAASAFLVQNGHDDVHNVPGGYSRWTAFGMDDADVIFIAATGWHMIGMGAAEYVTWEDCSVCDMHAIESVEQAEIDGWLQSLAYGFDNGYFAVGINGAGDTSDFQPRQGYWLLTYADELTIKLP